MRSVGMIFPVLRLFGGGPLSRGGRAFLALLILMSYVSTASAFQLFEQTDPPPGPRAILKVFAVSDPEEVRPGKQFRLHVRLHLAEGWHIYSMEMPGEDESLSTRIRLEKNVFPPLGRWEEPEPEIIQDGALEKVVKAHHGTVEFSRMFQVPEKLGSGVYSIAGAVVFRACDNNICTLPSESEFTAPVRVISKTSPSN